MVIRRALYSVLLAALLVLVLAACGCVWLLGTPSGARWLLARIDGQGGLRLEVQRVEGRVWGDLRLGGLRVQQGETAVQLDDLVLRWQPGDLLSGHLEVEEIALLNGEVSWAAAAEKPEAEPAPAPFILIWPQLPEWATRFSADLRRLSLENLSFGAGGAAPQLIEKLELAAGWHDGSLRLSELSLVVPEGRLDAAAAVGFLKPALTLSARADLAEPLGGLDRLEVDFDAAPAAQRDRIAGTLRAEGGSGKQVLLKLASKLSLDPARLQLEDLALSQPGRAGRLVGEVELAQPLLSTFKTRLEGTGVDLDPELGFKTNLFARLDAEGTLERVEGRLTLDNSGEGWERISLDTPLLLTPEGATVVGARCNWLGGRIDGDVKADWRDGVRVSATLAGRELDPSVLQPTLPGRINLDLKGRMSMQADQAPVVEFSGVLLDSVLFDRSLSGRVEAQLAGNDLTLSDLFLKGEGVDLSARGNLAQRIDFSGTVFDLSRFAPDVSGNADFRGWLRYQGDELSGALSSGGQHLQLAGVQVGAAELTASLSPAREIVTALSARTVQAGPLALDTLDLSLEGTADRHDIRLATAGKDLQGALSATGAYAGETWSGALERLDLQGEAFGAWNLERQADISLSPKKIILAPLRLVSGGEQSITLEGSMGPAEEEVRAKAEWRHFDLGLGLLLVPDLAPEGESSGTFTIARAPGEHLTLNAQQQASGSVRLADTVLEFSRIDLEVQGGEQGTSIRARVEPAAGGTLQGSLVSAVPTALSVPEGGDLAFEWDSIDLTMLRPWIPEGLLLEGSLHGSLEGRWFDSRALDIQGTAVVSGGHLRFRDGEDEIDLAMESADLDWLWRGDELTGNLALALSGYGTAAGSFRLPIPAAMPVVPTPSGPLEARLTAAVSEKGLVSALLPGLVSETRGDLSLDLAVVGSWETPRASGDLKLANAGGYLPDVGLELRDIEGALSLNEGGAGTMNLKVRSGEGLIEQQLAFVLADGRLSSYQGTLKGNRFRAVFLPELDVVCSPDLRFQGDQERIVLRGEIRVPDFKLQGREKRQIVRESPDVLLVGPAAPKRKQASASAYGIDSRVKVVLGDHVLINIGGVDARLAGSVDVAATGARDIKGWGKIDVAQGRYSGYGVTLDIERGSILFAGGPVDRPSLDILALRKAGEVKAGVSISGTPRYPVVKLYSEPGMPDTDILSYVVLGRPLGSDGAQASPLMTAAGVLLSQGESAMLQDRLKTMLGIDVIQVDTGGGDVTGSMVTLGKYLTPELYLSFGQSLFGQTNLVQLRYSFWKNWELESKFGEESGADLYYKIQFQ